MEKFIQQNFIQIKNSLDCKFIYSLQLFYELWKRGLETGSWPQVKEPERILIGQYRSRGRPNPRKYRVVEFLAWKTGSSARIVIILISQLVASVMLFVLDIASCAPGGRPRVVQFVCRFDIVTSSSLIMQPRRSWHRFLTFFR